MRRSVNYPSPIAAPTEMKTKDGPLFLAKARIADNQPRKVFMRGTSIPVFKSVLANWKDEALFLKLSVPSAGERQHFVAVVWQRQTTRRQPFNFVRRFTDIFDRSPYPEQAEVSTAENRDLQLQLSNRILPHENQQIHFALRTLQRNCVARPVRPRYAVRCPKNPRPYSGIIETSVFSNFDPGAAFGGSRRCSVTCWKASVPNG